MRIVLFTLAAAALTACSGNVSFRIDNPTDAPVDVTIDGAKHTVAPHTDVPVSLAPGKHALETATTGKIDFIVYVNGKGGIINPTFGDYVVVNQVYATSAKTAKGFATLNNKIVLGNEQFTGPFRVHRGLFIDKDWKYGVYEEFPESESVGTASGNIFGKVFAPGDFVAFYRRRYGVPEPAEQAPPPPALALEAASRLPDFDDPEVQKASMAIREQYERYIVCEDPSEQAKLQKATSQALTDFVTFMAPRMFKQAPAENQKHNDFVTAYGHAFGYSARPIIARRSL